MERLYKRLKVLKILHNIAHTHIICNVAEVIIYIYCLINGKVKKKPLQLSTAYFNARASILKKINSFQNKKQTAFCVKVTQNSALAENSYKRLAPFLLKKKIDHKRKIFLSRANAQRTL